MIAIETRFLGPTNHRGSRIVARCMESLPTRKVTIECADAQSIEANHKAAAIALIIKLGWTKSYYPSWVMGASERGYVFVCDTSDGYSRFDVQGAK